MKITSLPILLQGITQAPNVLIKGLALDSRQVQTGDLFFACSGAQADGRHFIADAVKKGAAAVLAEKDKAEKPSQHEEGVPVIYIQNLSQFISEIAARFYDYPGKQLKIIGITGTNGKTSCSHFIASILSHLGQPCGVMGTLGNGLYNDIKPSLLTTPDAITVQKTLAEFLNAGAKYVAMEVSSHSLDQGRVNAIPFEVGIFTNLTRDHLDYHATMEAYGAAKEKLFHYPMLKHAVINIDDDFGKKLIGTTTKNIIAFSRSSEKRYDIPLVYAKKIQLDIFGMSVEVVSPWGEGEFKTSLVGPFNVSNLLAVLSTLCLLDIPFHDALKALSTLKPVPGRMQSFGGDEKPLVVVDYSHTPDALEKALLALRSHCQGKLYCVFGCGGDRDKGKRPIMAKIAEKIADVVIVTDDNPRTEDPAQIVADIMGGFSHPQKVLVQHDRSEAIRDIIHYAKAGDCVLIAGKGAETYQQVGEQKIPFSDIEEVKSYL